MRKYMVTNLARQRDGAGQLVVVRYQNEFKDGKQTQLQGGDSIDICALQNSINIEDPDVRMMVKDVGPCDKAYERLSPAIPTDEFRGGAAGGGGGGGGTTGGGRNDRFETGNTGFFEDPSVQNTI
jgi:hypothetical protein